MTTSTGAIKVSIANSDGACCPAAVFYPVKAPLSDK